MYRNYGAAPWTDGRSHLAGIHLPCPLVCIYKNRMRPHNMHRRRGGDESIGRYDYIVARTYIER